MVKVQYNWKEGIMTEGGGVGVGVAATEINKCDGYQ